MRIDVEHRIEQHLVLCNCVREMFPFDEAGEHNSQIKRRHLANSLPKAPKAADPRVTQQP
ncbi:MAG TPA: hypothetical protein DCQ06_01045 [Myxococcales bacterium]|nr:hypothetical protein [Myxococcales bacterium]HAN30159.1 hypothetical protein [Myxococcales bacterium]